MTNDDARIVLATKNDHKLAELRAILDTVIPDFDESMITSSATFSVGEPVESGISFEENAVIKARNTAEATGKPAIADDSGIGVEVMGWAPGVFSARWSGGHGDDESNNQLLLDQLADVPAEHRRATFTCAAALVLPDGRIAVEVGHMYGTLLTAPQGNGGFGYDPLFQPDGYEVSAAELPAQTKNAISHRRHAFANLAPRIIDLLGRQTD